MNDTDSPGGITPDQAALARACRLAGQLGIVSPDVAENAAKNALTGALPGPASASFVLGIDLDLVAALVAIARAAKGEDEIAATVRAGQLPPTEFAATVHARQVGERGTTFDRYEVREELGRGGMGLVLAAHDPATRRLVAIKVLKPGLSRVAAAKFLDEGQVTAQLEHPNIIPVHEIGQTREGQAYFAMKKVKGETLAQLIHLVATHHVANPPLNRWLDVFTKLCDGVAYAHSRGIIHRDLKPMNAMLGEFGEVLILDWGIAKQLGRPEVGAPVAVSRPDTADTNDENTREGEELGTLAYMPPEQALGRLSEIDERADVYALGAILYEMVTHEQAFTAPSRAALIAKVIGGRLVPPSRTRRGASVPREIEAVVLRAMAARRDDRYASVLGLKADVEAFLEGRLLAAARYTPLQLAARWARRHKAALAPLAAAAAVLVCVVAWNRTRPGALAIAVGPPGAAVSIDGGPPVLSGTEPHRVTVPAGRHRVRATLDGHDAVEVEVALERRETRELAISLARQTGTVDLETEPAGALAWIDGAAHGTPLVGLALATGAHRAFVERDGAYREAVGLDVRSRARTRAYVALAPAVAWKRRGAESCQSIPIGDLDGDGIDEHLHWTYWIRLEVLNGATGALVLERPLPVEAETPGWAIDVTGDGRLELLTGLKVPEGGTRLVAIDLANGEARWATPTLPILTIAESGGPARPAPMFKRAPDLDGDGVDDILAVLGGPRLAAYSGRAGALLWEKSVPSARPAWHDVGDLSGDGRIDLLLEAPTALVALDGTSGQVVWTLPLGEPTVLLGAIPGGAGWVLGSAGAIEVVDRDGRSRGRRAVGPSRQGFTPDEHCRIARDGEALLVVGCRAGSVACWNVGNGAALWERPIEGTELHSVPTPDGGTMFVHRATGGLAIEAVYALDGRPAWRVEIGGGVGRIEVIDAGGTRFFLAYAGPELTRINPATGVVAWRWRAPAVISAGVARGVADPTVLVVGTAEGHVCWLGLDGTERASVKIDLPVDHLLPLHLDGDGIEDVLVRSQAGPTAVRGRRLLWQLDLGNALRAPPVVVPRAGGGNDVLVPLPGRGRGESIARFDGRTGQRRWETYFPHNMIRPAGVADLGAGLVGIAWKLGGSVALLDLDDGHITSELVVGTHGYAEPVAADLDGDGVRDVVAMGWFDDGVVVATSGKSRAKMWERRVGGGAWYGATIAAVDELARATVFVAANDGQVVALDGDTGAVRWSASTRAGNRAGIVVGSLAVGAPPVAVVATVDGRLVVFDARTGTVVRELAGVAGGASRPVLVDADGDGAVEVVLGTSRGLLCVSAEGQMRWLVSTASVNAAPVVCDLEGDGAREVLFGTMAGELVCAELATGRIRWRWGTGARMPIEAECAVADLDADGVLDVVMAGHDRTLSALSGR